MNRVVVTRSILGMARMQVCAVPDATDEEILTVCNRENPSGTERGWTSVVRNGGAVLSPVVCEDDGSRTHFVVTC